MFSRHFGCRLSDDYRWRGMRVLVLENEVLRTTVLLDKGADIAELRYKPRDLDFLWHSPNPVYYDLPSEPSVGLGEGPFADFYEGCWQEVLPNAGRTCEWNGAQFGLHGEVWGLPWEVKVLEDTPARVSVELSVRCRRMPLRLTRRMTLESDRAALFLDETLTNESDVELAVMWGHHPAYGEPFLGPSCRLWLPEAKVVVADGAGETSRTVGGATFPWPNGVGRDGAPVDISRIEPKSSRLDEMYYLTDLAAPWYAITNQDLGLGLGMAWRGTAFRCVWYWASLGGQTTWPAWGRWYTVALEPMSGWPALLTNALANGTELRLGPQATITEAMTAVVLDGPGPIAGVSVDGGAV
jgi:galactose mutarotase-like enzyme